MSILRRIWNFRPDPARYGSLGQRALRGLCFFLGLMLCFTLISRAADSMTVAEVSTQAPQRAGLQHRFELDGGVETVSSVPIVVSGGLKVTSVAVKEGDSVSAGDLLLVCDASEIQQQLSTGRLELQKLELQIQEIEEKRELDEEDGEAKVARAEEDLEMAVRRAEINVNNAVSDRDRARRALRDYDGDSEAEERQLEEALRSARRAVETAILEQTETLLQYQRAIEDAQPGTVSDIQLQSLAIDMQIKQMELTLLSQQLDGAGAVYAPFDGVVGSVDTATGRTTTGEAVLTLTDTGTLRVTAEVDNDQRKSLSQGATVALEGEDFDRITDLAVNSITQVEGESGKWKITVELPEDTALAPNRAVKVVISRRTDKYDTLVPLAALYQEGQNYYVLVLDETETVSGAQAVARRVEVALLDRNDSMAAVSGALSSSDRVIIASSKPLAENDRVRLS